jgi:Asp-tRNA(Asn)/Glu-tRNA(Gln) amidotransferase A subunit family amidase
MALDDALRLGATELRARLGKELSATELIEQTLERATLADEAINPFVHMLEERAYAAAAESDRRFAAGEARPLEGLPLTVKDTLWMEGIESADGSRARAGFVPSDTDLAVSRAQEAGAVIFAKTTNPELCYFGYSTSDLNGDTANPWDTTRTAGGSSSGAAAALAFGAGPLALGTDAGGSLRIPATFCGVAALKPTTGIVPNWPGLQPFPTLSVTGPMARHAADLELLLDVIAGYAPHDLSSLPCEPFPGPRDGVSELRVVVDVDRGGRIPIEPYARSAFERVLEELRAAGATVVGDRPDHGINAAEDWLTIAGAYARATHAPEYEAEPCLLGDEARIFLEFGETVGSLALARAERSRGDVHASYSAMLERNDADVFLTPALGLVAFGLDVVSPSHVDGVEIERPYDDWSGHIWDASLAGIPACVIPIGLDDDSGLPIGLQLMGRRFDDKRVLAAASAIEALLALDLRPGGEPT